MSSSVRAIGGHRQASSVHGSTDEFALALRIARAIVRARMAAGLSQAELATRMGTAQSFVARLESGRALPTTTTLLKIANATATRLHVDLVLPASAPITKGCTNVVPDAP